MFSENKKKLKPLRPKEDFEPYDYCFKRWGITRDQIISLKEKPTYRHFVEYEVHWKTKYGEEKRIFKMIIKGEKND
jgi:hypothetical protein